MFRKAGAFCLLALAYTWLDPLGLNDWTEVRSRNLFNYVFAPLYPGDREKVAVVLLTETASRKLDPTWPLSSKHHHSIITGILTAKPKALFIDFLFKDDREGFSRGHIAQALEHRDRSIPVFLAGSGAGAERLPGVIASAPNLVETAVPGGQPGPYPAAIDDFPTPAFAIHDKLCQTSRLCSPLAEQQRRPLIVFWGAGTPSGPIECTNDAPESPLGRLATLMVHHTFTEDCPFPVVLRADDVARAPKRVRPMLADRVVIYAPHFRGGIETPFSGNSPRAYLDAMAVNNLLTFGDQYLSDTSPSGAVSSKTVETAAIVMAGLLMLPFLRWSARSARRNRPIPAEWTFMLRQAALLRRLLRQAAPAAAYSVTTGCLLLAVIAAEVWFLRIAPGNWLSILGLASAVQIGFQMTIRGES